MTDSNHYLRLYAPNSASEVGVSQRHTGQEGTGVSIKPNTSNTLNYLLNLGDINIRLEGLDIDGSLYTGTAGTINIIQSSAGATSGTKILDSLLIHDFTTTAAGNSVEGLYLDRADTYYLKNVLMYDLTGAYQGAGINLNGSAVVNVYNSIFYNITSKGAVPAVGIGRSAGTLTVMNTYVGKMIGPTTYDYWGTMTKSYNVSSDSTASGTGSKTGKTDYENYFIEAGSSNTDLHLRNPSAVMWGTNGTDLSSDGTLPVTTDIDGDARPTSYRPDIGADEWTGGRLAYFSVGTSTANLSVGGNVTISDGEATFTTAQATNVGVGDQLVAGGITYYISGRNSATFYAVRTRTGAKPADLSSSAVTSISRAFNTLSTAVSNSSDSSHLGSATLTTANANVQLNLAAYKDGVFDEYVVINGYTTDSSHYLRIFAPYSSLDVGMSQRHTGKEGTGVVLKYNTTSSSLLTLLSIYSRNIHLEGIEIDGSSVTSTSILNGIYASNSATDSLIDSCLMHDLRSSGAGSSFIYGIVSDAAVKVRNTIVYDLINSNSGSNPFLSGIATATGSVVYNNITHNIRDTAGSGSPYAYGYSSSVTSTLMNNYCGAVASKVGVANCFNGSLTQAYNVSSTPPLLARDRRPARRIMKIILSKQGVRILICICVTPARSCGAPMAPI